MSVLVIGATGFIGQELCRQLSDAGYSAIGCGRRPVMDLPKEIVHRLDAYWNISDGEIPDYIWNKTRTVIFLAAIRPYAGFCMEDYLSNISIMEKYLSQAISHNVEQFLFASSKAVYSNFDRPAEESRFCTPSSLYGASKLAAEQLGMYYGAKKRINFTSLRLAQVIGIGEKKKNLVKVLIQNAMRKEPQIIYGTGEQRRHYIYLKDVCNAFMACISYPTACEVINIGMSANTSNREMAEAANKAFDNVGNIRFDMDKTMQGEDDEMIIEKAKKIIHFTPHWDIVGAFEDIKGSMRLEPYD